MLLIYTHKITPRFSYTMKQVFTRILGIDIIFTTKVEDFIKHTGPKITYSKQPLQNEFFVRSNELLFVHGINDLQITVEDWEGTPCFFRTKEPSVIPYDIFSASFYLLARYEEYLPYLKDTHGRFPPLESIASTNNFLQLPVVDIWAYRFLDKLKERFPAIVSKKRKFQHTSIIDVTSSHCFAHRGPVRSIAGLLYDLGTLKWKRVVQRTSVWLKIIKDPYNNYEDLIEIQKKYQIKSIFFFQFANYSTYDKNVSPENNNFKYLIKSVADYSVVALAASYSSFRDVKLLKEEKKRLSNVVNRPINYSRMRYNRVDVPHTYRNLVEAEFTDDYTMGYTHEMGFKAGTCTPFYFYDIAIEEKQPIKIHPFAVHDYALRNSNSEEEALEKIRMYYDQVKKVNGHFITIFSNELLGGDQAINWLDLYNKVIQKYHV
ncbi:polysaccharide deacetylase family protein [uncultured Eudoraea sp.]|uniref:polysaccharide deacetylase family protein n=1 Tax=uncultured Eudoraea sp. TaxID=1035614 RepID=UPI00263347F1|nr:polysaccharide deacetylase family protein [uncultured Eudoraea sp.]